MSILGRIRAEVVIGGTSLLAIAGALLVTHPEIITALPTEFDGTMDRIRGDCQNFVDGSIETVDIQNNFITDIPCSVLGVIPPDAGDFAMATITAITGIVISSFFTGEAVSNLPPVEHKIDDLFDPNYDIGDIHQISIHNEIHPNDPRFPDAQPTLHTSTYDLVRDDYHFSLRNVANNEATFFSSSSGDYYGSKAVSFDINVFNGTERDLGLHASSLVDNSIHYFDKTPGGPIQIYQSSWIAGQSDNFDHFIAELEASGYKIPNTRHEKFFANLKINHYDDVKDALFSTWTGERAIANGFTELKNVLFEFDRSGLIIAIKPFFERVLK